MDKYERLKKAILNYVLTMENLKEGKRMEKDQYKIDITFNLHEFFVSIMLCLILWKVW